ncbi:hypothetical protein [Candidatus Methylacidiphilum infernorum]|uniref:hypothetical protein n=1 Tax=Candidatus Methylacidiphilum infernorum TaxID=511746 RepID=UPI001F5C8A77|nr:hypothetical protein [Candidatus Methylacidiphilum infernorum]
MAKKALFFLFFFLFFIPLAYGQQQPYQPNGALSGVDPSLGPLIQKVFQFGQQARQEGQAIAVTIAPFLFFMAAAMGGFRVAFGRPIIDELIDYTIHAVIIWIVVYAQFPQQLIDYGRQALIQGGLQWGREIANLAFDPPMGSTPTQWWICWIHVPPSSGVGVVASPGAVCPGNIADFKFGPIFVSRMFGLANNLAIFNPVVYKYLNQAFQGLLSWMNIVKPDTMSPATQAITAMQIWAIPLMTSIGWVFALVLAAALLCIGAIFTIIFSQIVLLGGSEAAYQALTGFGIALVPLTFFASFRGLWRPMLMGLVAVSIVPTLYCILAGLGYMMADIIFNTLFGISASGDMGFVAGATTLGAMIPMIIEATIGWPINGLSLSNLFGGNIGHFSSLLQVFLQSIFTNNGALGGIPIQQCLEQANAPGGQPPFLCAVVYTILGLLQASGAWLYSLGINIVAAFIYAGSMFPLVAVRIAYGWSSAFADMAGALLEGFSGHFGRVHSAGIEGLRGVGENIQGRVGGVIRALAGKNEPPHG